jgi:septum formation protein
MFAVLITYTLIFLRVIRHLFILGTISKSGFIASASLTAGGCSFIRFSTLKREILMQIQVSGRLILASGSPRRSELLRLIGLDFEVMPSDIDETFHRGETPREHVLSLSAEKALAVALRHNDAWVLGADTIVIIGGEILGKPGSVAEAKKMLEKLSGREHKVFTGFSISRQEKGILVQEVVESTVLFREISVDEMDWYIHSEEPYDKAGAYAVQGMGALFIREIRGSYTNVIGLPLCEVIDALKRISAIDFIRGNHERHG